MILTFTYNVKANTVSTDVTNYVNMNGHMMTNVTNKINFGSNGNVFVNQGNGTIIWSLLLHYEGANNDGVGPITQVRIGNNVEQFVCDIGSPTWYYDSGKEMIFMTLKCPVTLANGRGINNFSIDAYTGFARGIIYPGAIMSFTSNTNEADTIVNAINTSTTAIINADTSNTGNLANAITQNTTNLIYAITGQSNQAHQDAQQIQNNIENIENYDARQGDGDSSRPDTSSIDNLNNRENAMFDTPQQMLDNAQRPQINLQPFISAINWIFTTMTSILNTNALLFSTLMIILSLGLLKLILCR